MSAEVMSFANGIMTVKFGGKLTQPELAGVQQRAAEIMETHPKTRILVLTENFQGWDKGGAWDDVSFQAKHDQQIERMAIVGDKKWEDLAMLFIGKGFRKFPIQYFPPAGIEDARAWLVADASAGTAKP
jgi:SpoIIAA-like